MGNRVKGFRFTDEYEDVFKYYDDGTFTYVCAEPYAWGYSMTATDYSRQADGTFEMGSTYPVTIDQLAYKWIPEYQADMRTAAEIVGIEFARAYHQQNVDFPEVYDDPESDDTMGLMDIAACHVLETSGAPDVFAWEDYDHWKKNFRQCIDPDID